MKKANYIILGILLLSFNNLFSQTTDEEYNYLTKGYQIQLESGLDMKKGYILNDATEYLVNLEGGDYKKVSFKYLQKENTKKDVAILAIFKYYKKLENKTITKCFCIPLFGTSDEIMNKAYDLIISFKDPENASIMTKALLKLSSYLMLK